MLSRCLKIRLKSIIDHLIKRNPEGWPTGLLISYLPHSSGAKPPQVVGVIALADLPDASRLHLPLLSNHSNKGNLSAVVNTAALVVMLHDPAKRHQSRHDSIDAPVRLALVGLHVTRLILLDAHV